MFQEQQAKIILIEATGNSSSKRFDRDPNLSKILMIVMSF